MRLSISPLSADETEDNITAYFAGAGIKAEYVTIMRDHYTGVSRGFAYVEVDGEELPDEINVTNLSGEPFDVRRVRATQLARPKLKSRKP